ncbi:hypothetical protein PK28_05785 [Hymenobacter sp. DG25B]|nr:hypothetical protein PK28_05785 [Hymenobacter sp. DG25B]
MITIIIITGIMIYNPTLFITMIAVMGPTAWLTYTMLRKRAQHIGSQTNTSRPITIGLLNNMFNGFIELKLAHKQEQLRDDLLSNQDKIHKLEAESYVYSLLPLKIIEMVAILGLITIFSYSVFISKSPQSSMTLLGLFAGAAYRLMPSINRILTSLVTIKQYQTTIEDLQLYRGHEYDASIPKKQLPLYFENQISLEGLTFSFPGTDSKVVDNINLTIKKGEIVGFIGTSGSGKTTLMNILLRFYNEKSGNIRVDDQVLTPQHIVSWHKIIGYVKQDTFLMESSIKENITLFEQEVDEERLNDAITKASLADFVKSLPDGVDTLIGERGSKLSGGQRQRIGIARALYKRSEILIMDEATSALDNDTEKEVNEAIHNLANTNITILIVAHRLTTLRDCNYIIELSNGHVVAKYDYDTLIQEKLFN